MVGIVLFYRNDVGYKVFDGRIFVYGFIYWVFVLCDKYGLFCRSLLLFVLLLLPLKNPSCRVSLNYFRFLLRFQASMPLDEFLGSYKGNSWMVLLFVLRLFGLL